MKANLSAGYAGPVGFSERVPSWWKVRQYFIGHFGRAFETRDSLSRRTKILIAVLVFFLSFAIKSLYSVDLAPLMYTSDQPAGGMSLQCDQWAASIVQGRGILTLEKRDAGDTSMLARAPGYPAFLSWIYSTCQRSYFVVQLAQNVINSASPVLAFLIGCELLGWQIGLAGGLLCAISHHLSYYSNLILPDSLCALPILAGAYILIRCRNGFLPYAAAGALFGLSNWVRPNGLLLAPFVGLILVLISSRKKKALTRCAILTLTSCLVVAPITIRNYISFGELVPIQLGSGFAFWQGIGEASHRRLGGVTSDADLLEEEAVENPAYGEWWASPDGILRDRERMSKSISVIRRHPFWFIGTAVGRIRVMLDYTSQAPLLHKEPIAPRSISALANENSISNETSLLPGRILKSARLPFRALQRAAKETALIFGLIGMIVVCMSDWRRGLCVLMIPLYYVMVQSLVHTEFRYVLPMHYFLFILGGFVWSSLSVGLWKLCRRTFTHVRLAMPMPKVGAGKEG
jgi:hypothetical protein